MEKIDKLFTTEQAAKELHISPRTLNNARSTGTGIVIPYHKMNLPETETAGEEISLTG